MSPLVARRYAVTFTVQARVDDMTPEFLREVFRHYGNPEETLAEPETAEYIERQRHLLQAVLADPALLERVLREEVARELAMLHDSDRYQCIVGTAEEKAEEELAPAIAKLSSEDRKFFAHVAEEGLFIENTDVFWECFQATLESCVVTELPTNEGE